MHRTPGVRTLINLLWLSDILTSRHTRITLLLKISLLAAFAPRLTAFKVAYTRVYAKQFYVDPNTIKFEIKNQGLFKAPPPPTLPKIQGLLKTVRTVNRHNWKREPFAEQIAKLQTKSENYNNFLETFSIWKSWKLLSRLEDPEISEQPTELVPWIFGRFKAEVSVNGNGRARILVCLRVFEEKSSKNQQRQHQWRTKGCSCSDGGRNRWDYIT